MVNECGEMEIGTMEDDPGPGATLGSNCFKCGIMFDDIKSVVQCTKCKNYYHGKCENVDFRGFHMRKVNWKCEKCTETQTENKNDGKQTRPRKRSRVDDYIDQDLIEGMNETLKILLQNTEELNKKMDILIAENQSLKTEIAKLKEVKSNSDTTPIASSQESGVSYASAVSNKSNNDKVLIVKPKGQQKDVVQIKKDLQDKVNPSEIRIGVSMGRTTRQGGLILSCGNEQDITAVQSKIQDKLGDSYEVNRPKVNEHRIKVVGVNESERNVSDESIIDRVIKQNELDRNDSNLNLKILRRTNVFNKKFNIIFEVDSSSYNLFINKQRMNLGWNRYMVFNEYGIIRCFNCNKYGHLQKECKEKKVCGKCSKDHDTKDCDNSSVGCINCITSNEKYGLTLNTNHTVWEVTKCETYSRIEKIQKDKFIQ